MDTTVTGIGAVVVAELRAAGYMESTIGQYQKSIKALAGLAGKRGGVYTASLGAEFASMTVSPRTGRFSAQRRFDYRRLASVFDSYVETGRVDLAVRKRGGGGPQPVSAEFAALWVSWEADMELDAYLEFKEKMGFYGASRIWYLKRFDAYCTAHDRTAFDRDTVEGWVSARLASCGSYRSWMSYIRDAGRWLKAHGNPDAYVLSDRWKAPFVSSHPYLLSGQEIEAFFAAAAHLDADSPWRWQATAFFTLVHSCGLRTGEARGLLSEHVHLSDGHLDIVSSKGNRSRRLPLTREVIGVVAVCEKESAEHFGASRHTFFVSATGNPVTAASVGKMFNRIWDRAGLARPSGGRQPRPYDFRHHFAYANVERWTANGVDVTAMLPYLARYMGHATVESSYYYIHTSPDFMGAYAEITEVIASVLPEVGFE